MTSCINCSAVLSGGFWNSAVTAFCFPPAPADRGRERPHDCDHADQKADEEQRENAALDHCHPRGIVTRSFVGRLSEFS
jgi:hypothetical protein